MPYDGLSLRPVVTCRQGVGENADGVCECNGRQAALHHSHVLVPVGGTVPGGGHCLALLLDWHS